MSLHPLWDNFPPLKDKLNTVADLIGGVGATAPASLKKAVEPLLLTPGKMLRPAFLLASSLRKDGDDNEDDRAFRAAAALELLHTASLIHDDVIDGASLRRGHITAHVSTGAKRAILAGDYLLAKGLSMAAGASEPRLVKVLADGVERLCLSEADQDFSGMGYFVSREQYFSRIRGKTAELFALSCYAGALLGGGDEKECDKLFQLGLHAGMAFQIDDDILDFRGTSGELGKKPGKDFREGIPTLPLILALEAGDKEIIRLCRRPLFKAAKVSRLIRSGGYLKEAEAVARDFRDRSRQELEGLNERRRDILSRLLDLLENRRT